MTDMPHPELPRQIVDQLEAKITTEAQAGEGERIVVLAVHTQDGHEMRKAIREVKPGADVLLATGPRDIGGYRATEFVMTEPFRSQRSIRMLLAAEHATRRAIPTHVQKGL